MEKDTIELRKLYEQVLILEDTELSKYGFSREFIRAIFSKFRIPHDSKFVKLNKMPTTAEFDDYYVVVARLKGSEEGIAVLRDYIYLIKGKEVKGSEFNFTSIKSAVDKNTIYGVVKNEELSSYSYNIDRAELKRKSYMPLADDIIRLLQTKFGSKFVEKIDSLQEYIYNNIRSFKLTPTVNRGRWANNAADIEKVMEVLVSLAKLKDNMKRHVDKNETDPHGVYTQVCTDVVKLFLAPYNIPDYGFDQGKAFEDFVTLFNKQPSFSRLAKLFLNALDRFEDEVLYYIHADYFKDIPWEQQEQKLKELKQKEITDASYSELDFIDLYNL